MEDESTGMTEDEQERYIQSLVGSTPTADPKHNVHTFLYGVATADDTLKLGNLNETEVGMPKLPVRTLKELQLFCNDVANMGYAGDYFGKKSEIMTASSLSKDAKLITLAISQKREIQQRLRGRTTTQNKSWFKKKDQATEEDY